MKQINYQQIKEWIKAKQIKIVFADSTRIVGDKDAGVDSFNLKLKRSTTANADKGSDNLTMDNVDAREAMVNAKTALVIHKNNQQRPPFATYVKEAKEN